MSYEKDYIAARKVCLDKFMALKPSTTLKTFVEEEKCKILAKAMDDANGNLDRMRPAQVAYNNYYPTYVTKIKTQIQKETVDKKKLETDLTAYHTTLKTLSNKYQADFAKLQVTEEQKRARAAAVGGQVGNVSAGANAAAAAAAEKHLKRALDDFKTRRTAHLTAITALGAEVEQALKDVKGWHAIARDSVAKALNEAKIGKLPQARQIADQAIAAAKSATDAATKLQSDYDKKITQVFQKDRNLGFATYESDSNFGLQKSQEGAWTAKQGEAKSIFDKAVGIGTTCLANIRNIAVLAKQAEEAAGAADDAAKIKDIRPAVRTSLASAMEQIDKLAAEIAEAITNQRGDSGSLSGGNKTLAQAAQAATRSAALQVAPMRARAIEEHVTKINSKMVQLEQIAKSQVGKVPPELKNEDEFKTALMKLGTTASTTKRQFISFSNDSKSVIDKLKALT